MSIFKFIRKKQIIPLEFNAFCDGELIDITEVNDEVFSTKMMGDGLAIIPRNGDIVSPVSGEIKMVFPTGHAIGFQTKSGIEAIIHVGINTVELNGRYFEVKVKVGDQIKTGQPLLSFDFEKMKDEGYDLTTMLVITKKDDQESILFSPKGTVRRGDRILTISKN